jgi:hypothetical protein
MLGIAHCPNNSRNVSRFASPAIFKLLSVIILVDVSPRYHSHTESRSFPGSIPAFAVTTAIVPQPGLELFISRI